MDEETKKVIQEAVKEAVEEAMKEQSAPQSKMMAVYGLTNELARLTKGVVLTAGAAFLVPMLITELSQRGYKNSIKPPHFDKEWKPEYIEVDETEEEKNDGSI